MHTASVGIFGASGYSGIELSRILAGHPDLALAFAASERFVGTTLEELAGIAGPVGRMQYVDFATAEAQAAKVDAVFLATPAEVSRELVARLRSTAVKIVDLSGAHRLADADATQKYYGFARAEAQAEAVYGLPELDRSKLPGAKLVANPGCYATASALALAPLLRLGLIRDDDLIVNAVSGVSGAGRKGSEDYSFVELSGDVKAYKVLKHQHTPEIAQALSRAAGRPVQLTFTPHLVPVPRGILATAYARTRGAHTSASLTAALAEHFKSEPFVRVLPTPDQVTLHRVVGTNLCALAVSCEPGDGGRVVVVSAIDNLVKGAAGQAVQNVNLLLGLEETAGLVSLRRQHP